MSHLSKRLSADSGRDRASGAPRPERSAERATAERSGAALSASPQVTALSWGFGLERAKGIEPLMTSLEG
jgi:hypothetical protein